MNEPLPYDHHGLPEHYFRPAHRVPRDFHAPTLRNTLAIIAMLFLLSVGLPLLLDVLERVYQSYTISAMVREAAAGAPACRVAVVDGVRIEHCIRTVWRF